MAFTSVCFLVFLLATLALYYLLPKKAQWVLLLAASYAFYWMGGGATVLYLVFTTLTVYVAGRILGCLLYTSSSGPGPGGASPKAVLRRPRRTGPPPL